MTSIKSDRKVTLDSLYWYTTGRNQGQIVQVSEPQIPGASEGAGGLGDGLVLSYDHGDRTWVVEDRERGELMRGKGDAPSVREAVEHRATVRHKEERDRRQQDSSFWKPCCKATTNHGVEQCVLNAGHDGPHCSPWGKF
jgi:hypothetical protein